MAELRISINLYNLRDFTKTPADIAQTLHRVKEIGYDSVQLSGMGPIDPEELRRMLEDEGLAVSATHTPLPRLQNELEAVVDNHRLWNCRHVGLGSIPQEYRSREGYERFAREGSAIGRKLAEADLTFSYHNHYWEMERFDGRTGLDILFADSDPQVFFAEIDTYWIQYGGGDPIAWIRRMKGREPLVHFKDMGFSGGKQIMTEVGEGNLNWPGIVQACRESGVELAIFEQDFSQRDPFESAAISLRNMKKMGLG